MPVWLSAWWAATCLVPWLIAFETVKHVAPRLTNRWAKITTLVIATATASLTAAAQHYANGSIMRMHEVGWATLVANQMQPALLFAVFIGLWAIERENQDVLGGGQAPPEPLPSLTSAEWIRAAGNYIELKCGDRLLIRRMTMRQAEEATRSAEFIRIHRSAIVRKTLIHEIRGAQAVLSTGEILPIGPSYRRSVARLVTSSQGSALRPIRL